MAVQQLSVFLENKTGRIADLLGLLGDKQVNVFGFSLADTTDYGIARLVVDHSELAARVLREGGFTAIQNPVICVGLDEGTGSLPSLARLLSEARVDIEYMYLTTNDAAVIKVDEPLGAEQVLRNSGLCVLEQKDIEPGV